MGGGSKSIIYTAVALMGAGAILIIFAWNGAASLDYTQGQIPFLISGGIGGLALVGAGLTLAIVNSVRGDLLRLAQRLDLVIEGISDLARGGATGPTVVPEAEGLRVVAGRTTYHARSCHLVEGRGDLQVMSPEAARDRGLAPCRICNPHADEASSA